MGSLFRWWNCALILHMSIVVAIPRLAGTIDGSATRGRPAATRDSGRLVIGGVKPIVVRQFLSGSDRSPRDHPDVIPLEFNEAIGIATVVDVDRDVSVDATVNGMAILQVEEVRYSQIAVKLLPPVTLFSRDFFSQVLNDSLTGPNLSGRKDTLLVDGGLSHLNDVFRPIFQ